MSLFAKKSIEGLLAESQDKSGMKKTLSSGALVALGIGAIIGAGLFSITGIAAANFAGPGIMISFIIAALGCAFAGLCYAEFSSMIPVAGSAYTYSYATMGEFVAWIIGWDLVLEYAVGAATVASSWSGYLNELFMHFGVSLPRALMMTPFDSVTTASGEVIHGIINLPAIFIVSVMSMVLMRGTGESAKLNNLIVIIKVAIVMIFIAVGFKYVNKANLTPLIPKNEGPFKYGWSGIFRAAGVVFFAYIGFDAVSTAAQETKDPKKSMPIGILGSLVVCTILYILFAYVMTGVANYKLFGAAGGNELAPVATAINHMGTIGANGQITPAYPWLNVIIIVAILLGYSSVIMVMLLGQSRVFYSMSHDGLLPSIFSKLHPKFKTPTKSNLLFMVFVSLFAAFVPGRIVGEMTSIGTLFAFILVCIGVIVMRRSKQQLPASFKTPFVPFVPIMGVVVCLAMMASLSTDTWIRLVIWMMIGFDIYLSRGIKHSKLGISDTNYDRHHSFNVTSICGLVACLLLAVLTFLHHHSEEGKNDMGLIILSIVVFVFHLVYYIGFWMKAKKMKASN